MFNRKKNYIAYLERELYSTIDDSQQYMNRQERRVAELEDEVNKLERWNEQEKEGAIFWYQRCKAETVERYHAEQALETQQEFSDAQAGKIKELRAGLEKSEARERVLQIQLDETEEALGAWKEYSDEWKNRANSSEETIKGLREELENAGAQIDFLQEVADSLIEAATPPAPPEIEVGPLSGSKQGDTAIRLVTRAFEQRITELEQSFDDKLTGLAATAISADIATAIGLDDLTDDFGELKKHTLRKLGELDEAIKKGYVS